MNFGQAVKELRGKCGFSSQQAFANHLGVSIRTVAGWEAGRLPRSHHLLILMNLAAAAELSDVYQALLFGHVDPRHAEIAGSFMLSDDEYLNTVINAAAEVMERDRWESLRAPMLKLLEPVIEEQANQAKTLLQEVWSGIAEKRSKTKSDGDPK